MPTSRLALRTQLTSSLRRRRRPLAGMLAAAAVLVALLAVMSPRPAESAPAPTSPNELAAGQVAIPVAVVRGADLAGPGTRIDLVSTSADDHSVAHVVAHDARVLSTASSGSLASTATTLLVAVTRTEALAIAAVPPDEPLAMLILER